MKVRNIFEYRQSSHRMTNMIQIKIKNEQIKIKADNRSKN